jgi:hypothetical protein
MPLFHAPADQVPQGNLTSQYANLHLAKSSIADRKCQTSITNYKKNGEAFIKFAVLMPINNSASTMDCCPSALFFFSLSSLIMK